MMRRPWLWILVIGVFGLLWAQRSTAEDASAAPGPIHDLRWSAEGVQFTLRLPPAAVTADGKVTVDGLTRSGAAPGAPILPYYSAYIALPPEAQVQLTVRVGAERATAVGAVAVAPAVRDEALPDDRMQVRSLEALGLTAEPDPAPAAADAFYPPVRYELSEPLYWRDLRLVQLTLYPLRYNPARSVLAETGAMHVALTFVGGAPTGRVGEPIPADLVLNAAQAADWRAWPADPPVDAALTALPTGVPVYKIEVERDGIYLLTYADLQAAGMPVDQVDPRTFQMLYGGNAVPYDPDVRATWSYPVLPQPVAYQFVGDADGRFEPGEGVRFYGWAWDGNRHDREYVARNVFWLWAGGSPTHIVAQDNPTGYTPVSSWTSAVTFEQDLVQTSTNTDRWPTFENEADAWYWDRFENAVNNVPVTRTYTIDLPHVAPTGSATVTAEVFSHFNINNHNINARFNAFTPFSRTWNSARSVNLHQTVPIAHLQTGANTLTLWGGSCCTTDGRLLTDRFHFNRVTVRYPRLLRADAGQLQFTYDRSGEYEFVVDGFSAVQAADYLVWDITRRLQPVQIAVGAADVGPGANGRAVRIGRSVAGSARLIAAVTSAVQRPSAVTRYVPPNLTPAEGANWVMIVYDGFRSEAERLAEHRRAHDGLLTHVVNYSDVINQYGYGLETPAALRAYMRHALFDWPIAPTYLTLGGDAVRNHRQRPCALCTGWDTTSRSYVLTPLLFVDRFVGQVPADHAFAMLVGDDLLPDLAVARLSAETLEQLAVQVDKIIWFDRETRAGAAWTDQIVFAADDRDSGGNFCVESHAVMDTHVPAPFQTTLYCLDDYLPNYGSAAAALAAMRTDLLARWRTPGAAIFNYRGHGSVTGWAAGLFDTTTILALDNRDKPSIVLSADCLDGYFALGTPLALSETMQRMDARRGSVAFWSSVGLGYTFEHTALHTAFYDAVYQYGASATGDAAVYAKINYVLNTPWHQSEVYLFTLQGDAAQGMPRRIEQLPAFALSQPTAQTIGLGETAVFTLTLTNHGARAATFALTADADPWSIALAPSQVQLAPGSSAVVTATLAPPPDLKHAVETFAVTARAREAAAVTQTAELRVLLDPYRAWLPLLAR